jgi:hypothetical protein
MASLLLAAGEPGERRALPNSRIMVRAAARAGAGAGRQACAAAAAAAGAAPGGGLQAPSLQAVPSVHSTASRASTCAEPGRRCRRAGAPAAGRRGGPGERHHDPGARDQPPQRHSAGPVRAAHGPGARGSGCAAGRRRGAACRAPSGAGPDAAEAAARRCAPAPQAPSAPKPPSTRCQPALNAPTPPTHHPHPHPCPERTLDRDNFMSSGEARAWGLIDDIILERSEGSASEFLE